jgi:hypothetical protein
MNQLGIARPCRDPSANTDGRALGYARRLGQQRRHRRVDDEWSIIMEFPALLCVGNAELVALESYLGAEIDAIFCEPVRDFAVSVSLHYPSVGARIRRDFG